MNTNRTIITSIFFIGLAAAVQTTSARELPESIEAFAEAQQQQILIQGYEARRAISWKLKADFEAERVAYIQSQLRGIEQQGEFALASIRQDIRSAELVGWPAVDGASYSFTDEQQRGMAAQGRAALDAIKSDLRLVGLDHPVERTLPDRMEAANWPAVSANTR